MFLIKKSTQERLDELNRKCIKIDKDHRSYVPPPKRKNKKKGSRTTDRFAKYQHPHHDHHQDQSIQSENLSSAEEVRDSMDADIDVQEMIEAFSRYLPVLGPSITDASTIRDGSCEKMACSQLTLGSGEVVHSYVVSHRALVSRLTFFDLSVYLHKHFDKGTFRFDFDSAAYHHNKHGLPDTTVEEYVASGVRPIKSVVTQGTTLVRRASDIRQFLRAFSDADTYLVITEENRIISFRDRQAHRRGR